MWFFLLVYIAEGMGQVGGLISQPLTYFLKTFLQWNPAQVTECLAYLTLPWVVKPVYGLLSDFFPLLGYRRKSYLFLANLLAVGSFLFLFRVTSSSQIVVALFLTAIGMAASSTICGAVMVENGKQTGLTGKFVSQQWIWFSIAGIATSLGGGWLCQHLSPTSAFHTAAAITAFAPVGVMAGAWFLIAEKKSQINVEQFKLSLKGLVSALKSRTLWIVAALLALWNFSPGFGTPMYYHMTDQLGFSQEFIGVLGAIGSVGAVIGSLVYMKWFDKRFTLRQLLYVSIVLGTISQGAYVLLHTERSGLVLSLMTSAATQVALLTMLTMAANSCPDKSEGFSYAALMSIFNLASQASAVFGAKLFTGEGITVLHYWTIQQPDFVRHIFQNHLTPLIWLSAVITATGFFFVPFLPKGLDHKDLAAKAAAAKLVEEAQLAQEAKSAQKASAALPESAKAAEEAK